MTKKAFLAAVLIVLMAPFASAQASGGATDKTVAITNARIIPVVGAEIAKGTIVIRNGLIAAVGADVAVPAGAEVFDAAGLTAYPGMIDGYSSLGLVEITRKRTRESLEHVLCEPCPACKGRGVMKTPQTVCYEIFREILREARQFGSDKYLVIASQMVIDLLLDEESTGLLNLQEFIGKPVHLQVDGLYNQEQFDVVLM